MRRNEKWAEIAVKVKAQKARTNVVAWMRSRKQHTS